jgi:hypothetical protein
MGVDSPLSYSHVVSGLAKSKESNVDVSFDNDILTPLDPPPFDLQLDPPPIKWDFQQRHFVGVVVKKQDKFLPNYLCIFDPLTQTHFYNTSKKFLDMGFLPGSFLAFTQGKKVSIGRQWRRGANGLKAMILFFFKKR